MTLLTEKDAATKRCQEGFAPPHDVGGKSYSMTQAFAAAGGWTTTEVRMTSPFFCIGSRCMAWRFANETNEFAQRIGYCGKVGKP